MRGYSTFIYFHYFHARLNEMILPSWCVISKVRRKSVIRSILTDWSSNSHQLVPQLACYQLFKLCDSPLVRSYVSPFVKVDISCNSTLRIFHVCSAMLRIFYKRLTFEIIVLLTHPMIWLTFPLMQTNSAHQNLIWNLRIPNLHFSTTNVFMNVNILKIWYVEKGKKRLKA